MKRKTENEKGYIDEFVEYQNNIYSYDYPKNGEMSIGVKYPNHPLGEAIFNWICSFILFLLNIYLCYMFYKEIEFYASIKEQLNTKELLSWYILLIIFIVPTIFMIFVGFGMFRKYKAKKRDMEIYKERAKRYKKRKILRKRQR